MISHGSISNLTDKLSCASSSTGLPNKPGSLLPTVPPTEHQPGGDWHAHASSPSVELELVENRASKILEMNQ